ncbi:kinase [Pseudoxanthomonas sp. UTMC 1351]|uniref:kinase n=1 Tax=Pseudoxanthomonas sp. UTMC 1351 TaxID=2695853 RepID=UPI0034CE4C79
MRYCLPMSPPQLPPPGFDAAFVDQALTAALASDTRPAVFALAGLQGSGKSTLASQVAATAHARNLRVAVLSLDDFYLTQVQRQTLAQEVHPLLAMRGPPGTHDTALACHTLDALRDARAVALPRFDKLSDDRLPEAQWPRVEGRVDLVIFEGWCLKTPAESAAALDQPINALEHDEDPDGRWRRWCNQALERAYPALWQRLETLWFLRGPGFEVVPDWRWQQEQALQHADPSKASMTRPQIDRFVQLFERVSRQALRTLPAIAQRTVDLDAQRRPVEP